MKMSIINKVPICSLGIWFLGFCCLIKTCSLKLPLIGTIRVVLHQTLTQLPCNSIWHHRGAAKFHCGVLSDVTQLGSWWRCVSCLQENEFTEILDTLLHHSTLLLLRWRIPISFLHLQYDSLENFHSSLCCKNIVETMWVCVTKGRWGAGVQREICHYFVLLGWGLHERSTPGISKFLPLLRLNNPVQNGKQTSLNWTRNGFYYAHSATAASLRNHGRGQKVDKDLCSPPTMKATSLFCWWPVDNLTGSFLPYFLSSFKTQFKQE